MTDFQMPSDDKAPTDAENAAREPSEPRADELPEWATVSEPADVEDVDIDILRVDSENGERVEELVEFEEAEQGGGVPNLADAELLDVVEDEDVEAGPREPSPFDRPGDWFVVHTYAG